MDRQELLGVLTTLLDSQHALVKSSLMVPDSLFSGSKAEQATQLIAFFEQSGRSLDELEAGVQNVLTSKPPDSGNKTNTLPASEPRTRVRVFICHKHEDLATAMFLNNKLKLFGGDKVSCLISDKITRGADWFDQISKELICADVLILLFTATQASRDWFLYEVGLVTNIKDDTPCKIVCFHSPDVSPPEPIKYAQAVKANESGIEEFLNAFFCSSDITGCDPPINANLANETETLRRLASELANDFTAVTPWKNYFTNFLWVIIDDGKVNTEEVPLSARIDPESTGLTAFGLGAKPPNKSCWTWGDLLARVNRNKTPEQLAQGEGWVKALGERFYWGSRGDNLKSMAHKFTCLKTGNAHRPLLNRVELRTDGSMLFEIILIEHTPELP